MNILIHIMIFSLKPLKRRFSITFYTKFWKYTLFIIFTYNILYVNIITPVSLRVEQYKFFILFDI